MTDRFTSSDGIHIAYHRWLCDSDLPPVVLHHGFAADTDVNWVAPGIVAALQAAGRSVIGIDARGHGQSDKPHDPASYGEARMAADVSTLLDHLGLASVDLAGYSMGAIVALLVATEDRRIRRLIVGGIGSSVVDLGGVDARVIDTSAVVEALRTDDPASVTDPSARLMRAFADGTGADRFALAAHMAVAHDHAVAFERITAPTLVLVGAGDALATKPARLAAAVPDARLHVVDGDHLTAVADPTFARALVGFLAGD